MISLIVTVKNEIKNLQDWFESVSNQKVKPDEIVVVDGKSDDGTWELLVEKKGSIKNLKIIQEEGNIAHGRNTAIRNCSGNIIVVTDAGCVYDKDWFSAIIKPFENKDVVWSATAFAPWFKDEDGFLVHLIASSTIPASNEFGHNWLPSSRSVAFYRDRWQTVGGYPEWIPFCEDVLLDKKLIRKDGYPYFIREVMVFWRPRTTIGKYFKQLFNYTRSEGQARLNPRRQVIRYSVYSFSLLFLVLSIIFSFWFLFPIMLGMFLYMSKFWKRWAQFAKNKSARFYYGGILVLPFVVVIGDIAKMFGYATGSYERVDGQGEVEYY